nr:hypothetical protein [Anaerolineae bacterium]
MAANRNQGGVRASVLGLLIAVCTAGCQTEVVPTALPETPTPEPTWTATPTSMPTLEPTLEQTPLPTEPGPEIVEQYRVPIYDQTESIYPLVGQIDYAVRIELQAITDSLDVVLTLENPAGDRLMTADSGGAGEAEIIGTFEFPGEGIYEIGIRAHGGEGEALLTIYKLEPSDIEGGGVLSVTGGQMTGVMARPGSYHTFRLQVVRGMRFNLWAQALTLDLDLLFYLYSPEGILIAAVDDTIGLDPYLWNFMPDQTGVYTVVLANYDENGGNYLLGVAPAESNGAATLHTTTILEISGFPRKSVWLTVDGQAMDGIRVFATPTTFAVDVTIAVYDPYGNRLQYIDEWDAGYQEKLSVFQFPYDGVYQIEFTTVLDGGTIEYTIQPLGLAEINNGGEISPGLTGLDGIIPGTGSLLSYYFDGQQDQIIGIDAHAMPSDRLDLGFDLYGPHGEHLATGSDTIGRNPQLSEFQLPETGRYTLVVYNVGRTWGHFSVLVTYPDAATPTPAPH